VLSGVSDHVEWLSGVSGDHVEWCDSPPDRVSGGRVGGVTPLLTV